VIVPDHIGSGLSEKPQNWTYHLKDHIDNVERLVDRLGLKEITLIVHDWGGAIGMGLATRRPELIKRLVLLNTAAFYIDDIPRRIQMCRLPVVGPWIVRRLNGFARAATWMASTKGLTKDVKKGYLLPYDSYENRVGVSAFVKDIPMEADHPTISTIRDIELKLATVKVPTLVLWGAKDFCFHKDFYSRWLEIYPDAKSVWYEDAGHYILEDAKERVIDEISSFLALEAKTSTF
jgi:haloalkane dehalogenase